MHRPGRAIPLALEPRDGDGMNITIIGTGNMARGIATRALEGGHGVTRLLEVFVAGDDAAKGVVAQLATDGGSTSARWRSRTSSRASAT